MNSGVIRLDQITPILLAMSNHACLLCLVILSNILGFTYAEHNLNLNYILNYIIVDQRKLLTVFRSVLCEIQRKQSNLLTLKN